MYSELPLVAWEIRSCKVWSLKPV